MQLIVTAKCRSDHSYFISTNLIQNINIHSKVQTHECVNAENPFPPNLPLEWPFHVCLFNVTTWLLPYTSSKILNAKIWLKGRTETYLHNVQLCWRLSQWRRRETQFFQAETCWVVVQKCDERKNKEERRRLWMKQMFFLPTQGI